MSRNYKFDNIRLLLIFCVVFAHCLELIPNTGFLYKIIYSFHMPAFIFLTGYFAKFQRKKIGLLFIVPYFLFQTLYLLFDSFILSDNQSIHLQYTTPYWLLWYLLTIIMYYLLIPLFQTENLTKRIVLFAITIVLSLCAGFDTSIGYYMSLSRFITFLPFFVAGYYCGHCSDKNAYKKKLPNVHLLQTIGIFAIVFAIFFIRKADITAPMLYGSYSYEGASYNIIIKMLLLFIAFIWIAFFFLFIPNKKLPILSVLGTHTYPIYLFHGFLIKLMAKYSVFHYGTARNIWLAVFFSVCLILLLGNRYTAAIFNVIARTRKP